MSNNPPYAELQLTQEEHEFLLRNCDSNITYALNTIQHGNLQRATVEKLVAQMEQFKAVKHKLQAARVG